MPRQQAITNFFRRNNNHPNQQHPRTSNSQAESLPTTENQATNIENSADIAENPGASTENPAAATENPAAATENQAVATENPATSTENPAAVTLFRFSAVELDVQRYYLYRFNLEDLRRLASQLDCRINVEQLNLHLWIYFCPVNMAWGCFPCFMRLNRLGRTDREHSLVYEKNWANQHSKLNRHSNCNKHNLSMRWFNTNFPNGYPSESSRLTTRVEGPIQVSARVANQALIELKIFNSDQLFKISKLLIDFYVQSIPTRGHRHEKITETLDPRFNPGNFIYFLHRESDRDQDLKGRRNEKSILE